jgi:hypothetical protein
LGKGQDTARVYYIVLSIMSHSSTKEEDMERTLRQGSGRERGNRPREAESGLNGWSTRHLDGWRHLV